MKIQFCSDLHLEMHQNQKWVKENPLIPNGDILIIAGDTDYLGSDFGKQDFFKKISDDFEQSYIIPGNHEYYGGFDISTAFGKTNEKLFDNVTLLNNDVVSYNEVQLIFSTMWSLIGRFKHEIVNAVADFRMITYKGQPLSTDRFNQLHRKSFEFIQKEASKEEQKIIITHHLPSDLCNAEEFRGSIYNDAFCVDKTDFIKHSNIDYWIYGHSHRNVGDIEISGTKMITNQLGYIAYGEQFAFERDRVIEI
ncbi:MAG: metallophosphoesterase [Aureibaculum sp.]|nr:metallophosphoesterase [Aureibaculum sp.]